MDNPSDQAATPARPFNSDHQNTQHRQWLEWSPDQSTWPPHLRDDAAVNRCSRCRRYTWATNEFGAECRMPQPDGQPCSGRFEPSSPPTLPDHR